MITPKGRHPALMATVIAAVCLAALHSCSRPLSDEYFTRTGKSEPEGEYAFIVTFGEEECDLDLYVSMVCGNVKEPLTISQNISSSVSTAKGIVQPLSARYSAGSSVIMEECTARIAMSSPCS